MAQKYRRQEKFFCAYCPDKNCGGKFRKKQYHHSNRTAKATDDNGAATTSSPTTITVNPTGSALFVVGNTTLSAVDTTIQTRLQNLGLSVTIKSATAAVSADATGKRVVVISDSVSPTSVNTKFRAVAVPVVTLSSQLFDDMGMTATTSGNFGTTATQKNVTITNAGHSMAAGLSGTVQVTSANTTFGWGKLNTNAVKIATLTTDSTKATNFRYEADSVWQRILPYLFRTACCLN